jgi:peptide/nickel transport system permease protein
VEFARLLVIRLVASVLVVFVVISVVFFVSRVVGEPISYLAPIDATPEELERLEQAYGLDEPIARQYVDFLWDVVRLDMGRSFRTNQPAVDEVTARMGKTLQLGVASLALSLTMGVGLGVVAAVYRGTMIDVLVRLVALLGQATPNFWLGLMLIFFFGVKLGWFPTGGSGSWKHLVLPTVTLGLLTSAGVMRITRSGMIDVLGMDFIRTARAKGLAERVVLWRHALRHALLPVFTLLGIQVGRLIAGSVIVETVFAWPGIGRLAVGAIQSADYPVVQTCILLITTTIVLGNLAVDLSYRFIDPRIRTGTL